MNGATAGALVLSALMLGLAVATTPAAAARVSRTTATNLDVDPAPERLERVASRCKLLRGRRPVPCQWLRVRDTSSGRAVVTRLSPAVEGFLALSVGDYTGDGTQDVWYRGHIGQGGAAPILRVYKVGPGLESEPSGLTTPAARTLGARTGARTLNCSKTPRSASREGRSGSGRAFALPARPTAARPESAFRTTRIREGGMCCTGAWSSRSIGPDSENAPARCERRGHGTAGVSSGANGTIRRAPLVTAGLRCHTTEGAGHEQTA
jgi:hypothetical protein